MSLRFYAIRKRLWKQALTHQEAAYDGISKYAPARPCASLRYVSVYGNKPLHTRWKHDGTTLQRHLCPHELQIALLLIVTLHVQNEHSWPEPYVYGMSAEDFSSIQRVYTITANP